MDGKDLESEQFNEINYCRHQNQQHHYYRYSRRPFSLLSSTFGSGSGSGSGFRAKPSFLFILVLINVFIVINLSVLSGAEYVYGEPKYKCPKR